VRVIVSVDDIPEDPQKAVEFIIDLIDVHGHGLTGNELARLITFLVLAAEHAQVSSNIVATIRSVHTRVVRSQGPYANLRSDLFRALQRIEQDRLAQRFQSARAPAPSFALSDDEVAQIIAKTGEMRSIVTRSSFFSVDHKRRLLGRIAQIEAEIHKPRGDFDVILGGVVDVGSALGEFGERVKPLVDRMREIQSIIQPKSEAYLGLPMPSDVKRLPSPKKDANNIETKSSKDADS